MKVKYSLTRELDFVNISSMADKKKMRVDLEFRHIGHTQDTWCKANGVHKSTFSSVLNGHRTSKPLMKKLEEHPMLLAAVQEHIKIKKEERANEKAEKEKQN
jgi:hypothetical protein